MVTSKTTEARQSALIIVDMSVEQVADLSYRKQDTINAIVHLVNDANFDLIVDSHLWKVQMMNHHYLIYIHTLDGN